MLLGRFIGMALATPAILMQPLGLLLKSMTAEFGWSRTEFAGVVAMASLANAIILPIAGYLVDRFGITLVGAMIGPLAMATIFDRTGSYDLDLMLDPAFPVIALALLWRARPFPPTRSIRAIVATQAT